MKTPEEQRASEIAPYLGAGVVDVDRLLHDPFTPNARKLAILRREEERLREIAKRGGVTLGSGEAARLQKVIMARRSLDVFD